MKSPRAVVTDAGEESNLKDIWNMDTKALPAVLGNPALVAQVAELVAEKMSELRGHCLPIARGRFAAYVCVENGVVSLGTYENRYQALAAIRSTRSDTSSWPVIGAPTWRESRRGAP
jgi:hypothetical protein